MLETLGKNKDIGETAAGSGRRLPAAGRVNSKRKIKRKINRINTTVSIPLALLDDHPDNPRGPVDETDPKFLELVFSMEADTQLDPVVAIKTENGRYLLIAGHRRKRAALRLQWTQISCTVIKNQTRAGQISLMLAENIHHQHLSYTQEARGFARLIKEGRTAWQIARATKVTKAYVETRLPVLKLLPPIQQMLDAGDLSLGAANQLARLEGDDQHRFAVRAQRMSIRNLAKLISHHLQPESGETESIERRRRRASHFKVLDDTEQFTRSWAVNRLEAAKKKKFTAEQLIHSFDDVCQDACIEDRSELACMGCPVPRLVASLLTRLKNKPSVPKTENGKKTGQ